MMIIRPHENDEWVHLTDHLPDDVLDAWWLVPGITLLRLTEVQQGWNDEEEVERWVLFSPHGELLGRLDGERTPGQARAWAKRKAKPRVVDVQFAALDRENSEQMTQTEAMSFAWVMINQGLFETFIPRSAQAVFAMMRSALHQARAVLPQDAQKAHAYIDWALSVTPPYILFMALQPGERCRLGNEKGELERFATYARIKGREQDGYNAEHIDEQEGDEPLTEDEREFEYIPPWTVVYQRPSSQKAGE